MTHFILRNTNILYFLILNDEPGVSLAHQFDSYSSDITHFYQKQHTYKSVVTLINIVHFLLS